RDSILTEAVPALFRIYEAADVAGLEFLYQSRYRLLSAESTHASFVSLTRTPSSVNADEVLASMIELLDLARAHAEEYAGPASA
ncbi:MAG TPA: hypothetical protein VFQ52_08045, partial [Rhizomicrobium sp.]|nr:hypothetical protein [Rhizomicrobium sp.]